MANKVVLILLVLVALTAAQYTTRRHQIITPKPNLGRCSLPLETGPCKIGGLYRFGFVPAKGWCQRFVYGGCGGNANNFETKKECEAACKPTGPRGYNNGRGGVGEE